MSLAPRSKPLREGEGPPVTTTGLCLRMHCMAKTLSSQQLGERLDEYFSIFDPTIELAEELISAKTNPLEVLILVCARIDALANATSVAGTPQTRAFIEFLARFSGHKKRFSEISAGDVYMYLSYYSFMAEAMIGSPGRIRVFMREDESIVQFVDRSGVPLTATDCEKLFARGLKALRKHHRVIPGQPHRKPLTCPIPKLNSTLASALTSRDTVDEAKIATALSNYLRDMSLASILYKKVRSGIIHGAEVPINEEKFFKEALPYWEPYEFEFGEFLMVDFPANFLLNLLKEGLKRLRRQFVASRKISPTIFWSVFADDGLSYLDLLNEDLLEDIPPLGLRHRARGGAATV